MKKKVSISPSNELGNFTSLVSRYKHLGKIVSLFDCFMINLTIDIAEIRVPSSLDPELARVRTHERGLVKLAREAEQTPRLRFARIRKFLWFKIMPYLLVLWLALIFIFFQTWFYQVLQSVLGFVLGGTIALFGVRLVFLILHGVAPKNLDGSLDMRYANNRGTGDDWKVALGGIVFVFAIAIFVGINAASWISWTTGPEAEVAENSARTWAQLVGAIVALLGLGFEILFKFKTRPAFCHVQLRDLKVLPRILIWAREVIFFLIWPFIYIYSKVKILLSKIANRNIDVSIIQLRN